MPRPTDIKKGHILLAVALATGLAFSLALWGRWSDPDFRFMHDSQGARWILANEVFDVHTRPAEGHSVVFNTTLSGSRIGGATLRVRALKIFVVIVNGSEIYSSQNLGANWKEITELDLTPHLRSNRNTLHVIVFNDDGPNLLWASIPEMGVATGPVWRASLDEGRSWIAVRLAKTPYRAGFSREFEPVKNYFFRSLIVLAPLFLAVLAIVFGLPALAERITPARLRFVLLAAVLILGLNNLTKVATLQGFDVQFHYDYLFYLLEYHRIPLATEGWEMFQSPLFYLATALLYPLLAAVTDEALASSLVRIVPVVCGVLQIEIAYRAARILFPESNREQFVCTLIAGLLPMNLYLSQYYGNEAMAAMFGGFVILATLHLIARDELPGPAGFLAYGALIGLALLTKVSTVLLIPPAFLFLLIHARGIGAPMPRLVSATLATAAGAFLVAGWYYLRNWYHLGTPFVSGWDPLRGLSWWQMPGFRTVGDYTRFGEVLSYPVYSSVSSLWDGLYSSLWLDGYIGDKLGPRLMPPWNRNLMFANAWLSLVPMAAIITGMAAPLVRMSGGRGAWTTREKQHLFCVACFAIYMLALLWLHMGRGTIGITKASYFSTLICCTGIFAAKGTALIPKNKVANALVAAFVTTWAFASYFAYFALQANEVNPPVVP